MSTKIYNGHCMPLIPMGELLTICRDLRVKAEEVRRERLRHFFIKEEFKWMETMNAAWDVGRKKIRNPIVDYSFEICFLPIKDKILLIPFYERHYDEILKTIPGIRYYGYWNNVDPDEECSEEEWAQREKDWDEALPGPGVPGENGFTITILNFDIPRPEEIWPK